MTTTTTTIAVVLLGLSLWTAIGNAAPGTQYLFALVNSTAQEALDFNRGVIAYTNSRISQNLRGDNTTINFTLYPVSAFAGGNLPPGALAVLGGSFDDSATWLANFNDNMMFPLSPSISQLNTTSDFGLAPSLEQLVYELARPMMRNLLATTFGVINTGTPSCAALVTAMVTEFDSNGLPQATVISASSDVAADVASLFSRGVQNVFSCETSATAIASTTRAAISLGSTVVFPFSTPAGVSSALSGIAVPDNAVWAPKWLANITNNSNVLVAACAAITNLTSEHVLEGCLAAATIERFVRFMPVTNSSAMFRTLANQMATLSTRLWVVGPFTPTCRAYTTVDALTYTGGILTLAADADTNMNPCSIDTALRMPPIIGVQLVYNNTDSIAAADALVAGARAFTAARNQQRQSPVYVQRIILPTPSGPLPARAGVILKVLNTSFGVGLWGCVDVTRALIDELGIFSLGRVDATAVAPSQALNDVTFVPHDGLVFGLIETEILTAFLFARSTAGRGSNLSLAIAVDDHAGVLWFETAQAAISQYQQAYLISGGSAIATSIANMVAQTQSYDFTMMVGPPTAAYAQGVCNVVNAASTHVLIPQMLGDSTVFATALTQCLTKPWNVLFMRDAVPSAATALGLQGFAARGYVLATLADALFSLAAQTNVSQYGQPLDVQSALYHSSSLAVGEVSLGGLTSVPCALAHAGEACECSEASRSRSLVDANGLVAVVLQVSPCNYGGITVRSTSTKYLTVNLACCGTALGVIVMVIAIAFRANQTKTIESDITANADPRLLKSVSEEVHAVLPSVHKRTSLFMLPFAVVAAVVGLSAALTLHFTLTGRLDDLSAETNMLLQAENAAACAASFVNFLLPAPSATLSSALERSCMSSAMELQVPSVAALTASILDRATTKLQAGASLSSTSDLPFTRVLCPLADQVVMNTLRHGADRTALAVAASAAMRVGGVLAAVSYFSPIAAAVAFATGATSVAPNVTDDDVAACQCFTMGYATLVAMLNSPVVQNPNTLAFVQSSDGWLVNTLLTCVAGNVATDGKMTLATAACMSSALNGLGVTPASLSTMAANWSVVVMDEALEAVRVAARSPQHDDLYQYLVSLWLVTAVSIVTGVIVRIMAGRVMKVSASQFTDAVTRSKVIEANIARYISVSMLELMNVNSVHEINGDGVMRDVVVVHINYYRALYKSAKKLSVTHGELLRRMLHVITTEAGSGRVESASDQGATILFDSAPDAMHCALRLEATLTALLAGTSMLNSQDVKHASKAKDDDNEEASDDETSESTTPPTMPNLTLESPEEAAGQVPAVTFALHRDVVAVGFMFTGRYQFPGAHGSAVRTAKCLAAAARRYGARIVATANVIDSIPAEEHVLVTRELGPMKAKWFDAMVIYEVCIPSPRCRLDEYKPGTIDAMRAISEAQQACDVPATTQQSEHYVSVVARVAQMAHDADVTDPAIGEKLRWSGTAPYDVLEF